MPETAHSIDTETKALKIPPHSIEAEQAVLGGIFLDKDAWIKIVERVRKDDFYRRDHQVIFNAVTSLEADGKPFDLVTVQSGWKVTNNWMKLEDFLILLPWLRILQVQRISVPMLISSESVPYFAN